MANPHTSRTAAVRQQARAAPDDIWVPFIRDLYPSLLSRTFFLPPIHFNRTSQTVEEIAGQTVLVRDNPSSSGLHQQSLPSPLAQVAGTVYVENPSDLQPFHTQDTDHQDDVAQQRCLHALSNITNQVMMVISSLLFHKYLHNPSNPLHAAAIAQLPTIQDPSIPEHIADGECDIVVIHRVYGLVIGEIKSVGGSDFFRGQSPAAQVQLIIKQIGKAAKQLNNQETALRHLVSDLPLIRITKILLLPNISTGQLQSALSASPPLLQTLCQTISVQTDVNQAVAHCLCEQDIHQPSSWWQTLLTASPDLSMSDDLYERLVARFCGPATTVDIPTAGPPRKVVRAFGEAVAETGLRFSSLTLTPAQVTLLNRQPEPRYLCLQGPPGTGKTVVLLLKALQWARQGRQVMIVSGDRQSLAAVTLVEAQLRSLVGPAAAASVRRHCCNFFDDGFDARVAVSNLQQQIGPGPALFIFDEFDSHYSNKCMQWLIEVRAQLPAVSVWIASVWRLDMNLVNANLPWLEVQTLQEPLRCPPTVTTELQRLWYLKASIIPQYSEPQHPVPTQGPPVQRLQHKGQPNHSGSFPWQCVACSDRIADIFGQLRLGQPDHPLQYKDVWILYGHDDVVPRADHVVVQQLQQRHGLPVGIVRSRKPSQADAREVALALTNQVMVTHWDVVQGLGRRVVIVLSSGGSDADPLSRSRCSSLLYMID